jgi:hypothetical protein
MAEDVSKLVVGYCYYNGDGDNVVAHWSGQSHGVTVEYETTNVEATFYVSPIWNMREKGVALVDETGQMVVNRRENR